MTGERKQNVNQSWSTPRPSLFILLLHHFCVKLSHFYVILFGMHHGGNSAVGIRGTRFYQRISGQMFPKLSGGPGCLPVRADFCEQLYREYLFFWLPRYFDALPERIHLCLSMTVSTHRSKTCQSLGIVHFSPA